MHTLADYGRYLQKRFSDEQIERAIEVARMVLVTSTERDLKLEAFDSLVKLIRARRPERVMQMERERGLRLQ